MWTALSSALSSVAMETCFGFTFTEEDRRKLLKLISNVETLVVKYLPFCQMSDRESNAV